MHRRLGLVVALSVCATRDFITHNNLMEYVTLAREWKASFIQVLEPRAAGHYANKDVSPTEDQKTVLHNFFLMMNHNRKYQHYPIVIYHESYLKTMGCFGAGNRFLYVDPFANIHACPFCRKPSGNVLHDNLDESIKALRSIGCSSFATAPH